MAERAKNSHINKIIWSGLCRPGTKDYL